MHLQSNTSSWSWIGGAAAVQLHVIHLPSYAFSLYEDPVVYLPDASGGSQQNMQRTAKSSSVHAANPDLD